MRRSLLISLLAGLLVLFASIFAAATRGAAPVPSLTIDPTSWTTASATVGDTTSQSFAVTYSGKGNSGPLHTGLLSNSGVPQYFYFTDAGNGCEGMTLSPKNPTCTITMYFHPLTTTTSTQTLAVAGRKLSANVSLSGAGQAAGLPGLSINDPAAIAYGGTINFTVTMSRTSTTPVTFDWATADGTAVWVSGTTCGGFNGPNDYVAGSGTKTIPAGSTSTTISVGTCSTGPGNTGGQRTYFTVTISNPSGATITGTGIGTGTLNPT